MEINEASARLRALAKDDKKRTETARLRDVFDDVEAALTAGVSQINVLGELKTLGFTMTMASFKSALQRIRKDRNKEDKTAAQAGAKTLATPDLLGGVPPGKSEYSPDETGKNSNRPPPLLSEDKGIWGQLKPSPVDGTVDLKQK